MGFWSSFFRETGKNTGKWASNKVFGSGWSTPHRLDLHTHTETKDDHLYERLEIERQQNERDYEEIKRTDIDSSNTNDIIAKLDDLLSMASIGIQKQQSINAYATKIRSGILHLKRNGEQELAVHYQNELNLLYRKINLNRAFILILIISIICLWIFLAIKLKIFKD